MENEQERLGKAAHKAYVDAVKRHSREVHVVEWGDLPDHLRHAWEGSAVAVKNELAAIASAKAAEATEGAKR